MADGIEERISVTGAEESKRKLDEVAGAQERVGKGVDSTGAESERAAGKHGALGDVFDIVTRRALAFAGSLIGAAGVTAAIRASREEAEKATEAMRSYVDALAATIALSQDKEFLGIASKASISSGRPIEEIGESLFAIVSGTAGASRDTQQALLEQSVELGKTEPLVPLSQVTELVVRLFNVAGGKLDPQQVQNLAIKTEDLGQINIGQAARFLPRTLGPGQTAGFELAETAAMFALLSQVLKPELAATATENIVTRLAAPGEEAKRFYRKLGIPADATAEERLAALAARQAQEPLTAVQTRDLVGEGPGAAALPVLLEQYDRFLDFQRQIVDASQPGAPDLGAIKVQKLRELLPGFNEVEYARQVEQQREAQRATSPDARSREAYRAALDEYLLESGRSPYGRWKDLALFDLAQWLGAEPETALNVSFGTRLDYFSTGERVQRIRQRAQNVTIIGTKFETVDPLTEPQAPLDRND